MRLRKFHIDQFPQDRIFVLFDENYHKELFTMIRKKYGFVKLNKLFFNRKLNYSTYKRWRRGKTILKNRVKINFIPLWFVIKLFKFFSEEIYSIKEMEKHIVAYKGPSTSTPIRNPNLPLVEDERLIRIVTHILCDGYVGGGAGTGSPQGKSSSGYRNFELSLLNQFQRDLSVFGEIESSKNYKKGYILFPNAIRYIFEEIYNIDFGTFSGRLPKDFWNLDKKLVREVIKAFGDDESHVYDEHIDFYSVNRNFLLDLKSLIQKYFPSIKVSNIKINIKSKNPKYYFYVLAESRKQFADEINFHHKEKIKDLKFNIERCERKIHKGLNVTKNEILAILHENPSTAKEISRKLYIAHGTVLEHLNDLKRDKKVKIIGNGKYNSNIWSTEK